MRNQLYLHVDPNAVADNYRTLKGRSSPQCTTGAVIKAHAYGLGMINVIPALEAAGARIFFVATFEEGVAFRQAGYNHPLYVFSGVPRGSEDAFIEYNISPVLCSMEQLTRWKIVAEKVGVKTPSCGLQVDTGMNRLGLEESDKALLEKTPELLQFLKPDIMLSHLSSADDPASDETHRQAERMQGWAAFARHTLDLAPKISLCASSGLWTYPEYHYDMTRPGAALYGICPLPGMRGILKPAISLSAPVLQVRTARKGESAGYTCTWRAEKDTRLAVIAMGYADGLFRSQSNRGHVYWQGHACRLAGRVSMDSITVILPDNVPPPNPGDMVEIIGPNQSIDALAMESGTSGYEMLVSLGQYSEKIVMPLDRGNMTADTDMQKMHA